MSSSRHVVYAADVRYCPAKDCPYALKFGRPGEYRDDATTCSDCGATLSDEAPVAETAPSLPGDPSLPARWGLTLAAAAALVVLARLPLLGVPASVVGSAGPELPLRMLAVGMSPFVGSFVLVELFALVVPGLRQLRVGGREARAPLDRAAWGLGGLFWVMQVASMLRIASQQFDLPPAPLLWGQLAIAELTMLGLATLVTRRGLGNGFGLVFATSLLDELVVALAPLGRLDATSPAVLMAVVLLLGGAVAVTRRLLRAPGGASPFPTMVPQPVSTASSFQSAAALLSMPASLAMLLQLDALRWQPRSTFVYLGLMSFLAIDLALLLGFLFFRPAAVGTLWTKWVPSAERTRVVLAARSLLVPALAVSVVLTVGIPLALAAGAQFFHVQVSLRGAAVVVLTAVALDVVGEWRARQRLGELLPVWELQRTAEVEPVLFLLRGAGIEAHAQGFFNRATQQFFGPWMPVRVLVPRAKADEARALIASRAAA
ncbi:MAG: hypothetical protein ACOZQL_07040 [Myxococcota bacterium]